MKNNFVNFVNKTISLSMRMNKNVICFGLGVTDPKGVFGTTLNLEKKFGSSRVFDVPASENSLTGMSIGASMLGTIPILNHQRLDFALLSLDQIINQAAKWYYLYGGQINIPITIRMITGRGWGQGPTHSQNLQALFTHIPGLKVVMPSLIDDLPTLLLSSIFDKNPVIFIENRWLHFSETKKKFNPKIRSLPYHRKISSGKNITIICHSYMTIEAIKASKILKKEFNVEAEIIDLVCLNPIKEKIFIDSINKTKNLLLVDTSYMTGNFSCNLLAKFINLNYINKPQILAMPDFPEPTSTFMTKNFYNDYVSIINKVLEILKIKKLYKTDKKNHIHDQPVDYYMGPF